MQIIQINIWYIFTLFLLLFFKMLKISFLIFSFILKISMLLRLQQVTNSNKEEISSGFYESSNASTTSSTSPLSYNKIDFESNICLSDNENEIVKNTRTQNGLVNSIKTKSKIESSL